jgi:hypothetical protein
MSNAVRDLQSQNITMLGIGPMSKRVVDVTIDVANELKKPISLIPSRRQIECEELGGGYVNSWNTRTFCEYVKSKDKSGLVFLSRDHSGPWQFRLKDNNGDPLNHTQAMIEAKISLSQDIECGFDLLHIDPSQGLLFGRSEEDIIDDIVDLIDFCWAQSKKKHFEFEVGADEQSMTPDLPSIAEQKLAKIIDRLSQKALPLPLFYVLQTGTKVKEMRNIGSFSTKVPVRDMLSPIFQIPEVIQVCRKWNVLLKEHNADYLPKDSLRWHPRLSVPAANVAPEFGVVETRSLLKLAKDYQESWFIESFSRIILDGKKWTKWMLDGTQANDFEKVQIAGHYHFSEELTADLISRLESNLRKKGIDLEKVVTTQIRTAIDRYLYAFGYYE